MIILQGTNRSVHVTTGNANSLDWSVSWVDVTASVTYTPGDDCGNIASATTTEIIPAPADGTARTVKALSFTNVGAAPQIVTVKKDKAGTKRVLTSPVSLEVGQTLFWSEATGWQVLNFSATPTDAPLQYITLSHTTLNPADDTTYYFGRDVNLAPTAIEKIRAVTFMKDVVITRAWLRATLTETSGTAEDVAFYIRKNATSDTLIASDVKFNMGAYTLALYKNEAINLSLNAEDYIEIKWGAQTFATNPTGTYVEVILEYQVV